MSGRGDSIGMTGNLVRQIVLNFGAIYGVS
jgi:hypothetical protein